MTIRYSLSHILLVVTIVAVSCAWIIERRKSAALAEKYLSAYERVTAILQNEDIILTILKRDANYPMISASTRNSIDMVLQGNEELRKNLSLSLGWSVEGMGIK
jgi:hypothetical protein